MFLSDVILSGSQSEGWKGLLLSCRATECQGTNQESTLLTLPCILCSTLLFPIFFLPPLHFPFLSLLPLISLLVPLPHCPLFSPPSLPFSSLSFPSLPLLFPTHPHLFSPFSPPPTWLLWGKQRERGGHGLSPPSALFPAASCS